MKTSQYNTHRWQFRRQQKRGWFLNGIHLCAM